MFLLFLISWWYCFLIFNRFIILDPLICCFFWLYIILLFVLWIIFVHLCRLWQVFSIFLSSILIYLSNLCQLINPFSFLANWRLLRVQILCQRISLWAIGCKNQRIWYTLIRRGRFNTVFRTLNPPILNTIWNLRH